MDDDLFQGFLIAIVVLFFAIMIVGVAREIVVGSIIKDCNTTATFRIGDSAFECKPMPQKGQK